MQSRRASPRETVANEVYRMRDANEDNVIVVGSVRGEDTTLYTLRFDSEQEFLRALELLSSFAKSTQSTRTTEPTAQNSKDPGFGNSNGRPMSPRKNPQVTTLSTNSSSSFSSSSSSSSSVSKLSTSSISLPSYLRAGLRSGSGDSDASYSLPINQSNQFSPNKSLSAMPTRSNPPNKTFWQTPKVQIVRQKESSRRMVPHRRSRTVTMFDSTVEIVPMDIKTNNRPRISVALTKRPPSVVERREILDLSYSISSSSESLSSSISSSDCCTDSGWSEASQSTIRCHHEFSFLMPPFQSPRRSISICSKQPPMLWDKFSDSKKAKVHQIQAVSDFC